MIAIDDPQLHLIGLAFEHSFEQERRFKRHAKLVIVSGYQVKRHTERLREVTLKEGWIVMCVPERLIELAVLPEKWRLHPRCGNPGHRFRVDRWAKCRGGCNLVRIAKGKANRADSHLRRALQRADRRGSRLSDTSCR